MGFGHPKPHPNLNLDGKIIKLKSHKIVTKCHNPRRPWCHGWRCDFEILRVVVARMACCYDSVQRTYSAQNCCLLFQTNKCWWTISSCPIETSNKARGEMCSDTNSGVGHPNQDWDRTNSGIRHPNQDWDRTNCGTGRPNLDWETLWLTQSPCSHIASSKSELGHPNTRTTSNDLRNSATDS